MKAKLFFSILLVLIGLMPVLGQAPVASPTPFIGGPTSIFTTYDAQTLRRGEYKFSEAYDNEVVTVQDQKLASKLMGREMPYRVVLPASYASAKDKKYPVLYLLHGLTGHYNNWTDMTKIREHAAAYEMIIVTPEGGDGWYVDSVSKADDKYESYIIQELIPEIEKKFRALNTRDKRAVAGLSMGGYGAIKFGLKYPEKFVIAGSFSGALGAAEITEKTFPGAIGKTLDATMGADGSASRKSNDIFDIIRTASHEKIKTFPFLYQDCGTEDFLFQNNRDFVALMLEKKVPHEYRQLPGIHDWKYWDKQLPEFLQVANRFFGN